MVRVCTSAIFMTYTACLKTLLTPWQMSAAQAGPVYASLAAGFTISLLIAVTAIYGFVKTTDTAMPPPTIRTHCRPTGQAASWDCARSYT